MRRIGPVSEQRVASRRRRCAGRLVTGIEDHPKHDRHGQCLQLLEQVESRAVAPSLYSLGGEPVDELSASAESRAREARLDETPEREVLLRRPRRDRWLGSSTVPAEPPGRRNRPPELALAAHEHVLDVLGIGQHPVLAAPEAHRGEVSVPPRRLEHDLRRVPPQAAERPECSPAGRRRSGDTRPRGGAVVHSLR